MTVLAAGRWRTNGDLIADVAQLYIKPGDVVLDPTFGKGGFWTKTRPDGLICHDLHILDGVDFRHLPEDDESVDVVTFDPSYVSKGGRETSTIHQMNDAYGMNTTAKNPAEQWLVIMAGMGECRRVLKREGLLMVKCMPYITSGTYQNYPLLVMKVLNDLGCEIIDQFVLVRPGPGPQPSTNLDGSPRRQVHARNNYSLLIIGRKK